MRVALENYQGSAPALAPHIDETRRPYILELAIISPEQDKDIVLAYLVRAAVKAKEEESWSEQSGKVAIAIDEFVRRAVDTIMGIKAKEVTAFLQVILKDLVHRYKFDEYIPSSGPLLSIGPISRIIIFLRNDIFKVSFYKILLYF